MLRSFLIFLLIVLLSAIVALAVQPLLAPGAGPAPLADLTPVLPTPTPGLAEPAVPALPTPTALPLPTHVVDVPNAPDKQPASAPKSLLDEYLPGRELVAETEHFGMYASNDGYFPVNRDWFVYQAEIVYDYVSRRLDGANVAHKVELGFLPPDQRACPVRGLASHNETPMILLYAAENSPSAYILAVLAHELGHAIPSEGFPGGLPDDQALTEGLATWASGKYWAGWIGAPDLDEIVRGYIQRGEYEPLYNNVDFTGMYPWQEDTGENCLVRRDQIYTEWGVFLGYLIDTYGWDKAYRLFQAPAPVRQGEVEIQFPPDYEGVYGRSLNQLEYEWLRYLSVPTQNAPNFFE